MVWDRRQVAKLVIDALCAYNVDNGEFPPFLLGGGKNSLQQMMENKDPLVAGGYLLDYPPYFPSLDYCMCSSHCWPFDKREGERWLCMFSTPGDHQFYGLSRVQIARRNEPDPEMLDVPYDQPGPEDRLYALGGRRHFFSGLNSYSSYSFWPGRFVDTEMLLRRTHGPYVPLRFFPFFGYQRGEHMGTDSSEAWLWFYGNNRPAALSQLVPVSLRRPEFNGYEPQDETVVSDQTMNDLHARSGLFPLYEPQGLDLINAKSGEMQPDGIPDGICLLYKLKDGKLIESIAAEGLN
jgi:hypothetical protein